MKVTGPGGLVINFPEGTDPATIDRVMMEARQASGTAAQPNRIDEAFAAAEEQEPTRLNTRGVLPDFGATDYMKGSLPFGDELAAAVQAPSRMMRHGGSFSDAYNIEKALEQRYREEYETDNPKTALASGAASIAALGPGKAAQSVLGSMGQGSAVGALYGAGEGSGLQERATNAALGGGVGGALGGVGGAVAKGVSKLAARKTPAAQAVPTIDELKSSSQAIYQGLEKSGVTVPPDAFKQVADDMLRKVVRRMDKDVHPDVWAAMRRVALARKASKPISFEEVGNLRSLLQDAADSPKLAEARLGKIVLKEFDRGTDKLFVGAPEARKLWYQMSKAQTIQKVLDHAELDSTGNYTQAGLEHATRLGFKRLYKNKDELMRFSPEEQKLIRKIANGGGIASMQNFLRGLGKFTFRGPVASFFLGATTLANPAVGLGLAATGEAARYAATKMSMKNIRGLDEMVRGGLSAPPAPPVGASGPMDFQRFLTNEALGLGVPYLNREEPVF